MNRKQFVVGICLLLLLISGVCSASGSEITDVERQLPSSFSKGDAAEITLEITGETPFMVGIVETIPQGFTFPENDADISSAEYFKVERDAGKISFSVSDSNEVTYHVIPSGGSDNAFEGYWVDMLYLTQELNEGKDRWVAVTDPNSESSSHTSADVSSDETDVESSIPGFSMLVSSASILACVLFLRKYNSGEDKE